jgi:MFS family permease
MRAIPQGKFQSLLIAIHLLLYISSSFVIYNIGFLQMSPAYECTTNYANGTVSSYPCSRNAVCELEILADNPSDLESTSWHVDWTNTHSLRNWITWLNLHCDSMLVGFFGTLYFLGFLISSYFINPLADKIGRLRIFLCGTAVQLIALNIMLFVKTLPAQYLGIFLVGLSQPVKSMVAFTHLMEYMTD